MRYRYTNETLIIVSKRQNLDVISGLSSLVVTLLVASVNGAPTMTVNAERLNSPPKWVNPCGYSSDDFDSDPDVEQLRDVQLLTQVVVQAKTALMHAQLFRDDYVSTLLRNFIRI